MLKGKNAIITGASRGIGKAIAIRFCEAGANVLLVYRSSAGEAGRVQADLGPRAACMQGDVADPKTAEEAVAKCLDLWGSVDILVNNAGITRDKLIVRMDADDFGDVLDVNLKGSFNFLKAASKVMSKQKSGSIINMSSVSGIYGNPAQVNYSASKAGVIGMTRSAAKELGRRGIRVNAIAPGFIDTDMTAVLTDSQRDAASEGISLGRIGRPEDIASAALFLASESSSYITGQVISIDGGLRL